MSLENRDNGGTESFTELIPGTKVGHYKIISKIGAGGMGEVFLAEDTELKRQVALKFLPLQFLSDDNAKARFRREAQATAKLNHPNIVTIYEVSEYLNRPFFAMECCDGKPLQEIIKKIELSIDDSINLTIQICEGLEKAHQAGIVHRDIKPANIVIDSDQRPKLLDFGLATVPGTEKLTQTGSTLGTVGYMSPEQVNGQKVDARSDLFSMGVILYEMITGRRPFEAEYEAATMNAILHETPEPLSKYKSNVPDQLQQIVTKLMEKNPSYRYQSASGLLSDLKRLSSKSTQTAKPIDNWNRYVVPSTLVVLLIIFAMWKFGFLDYAPIYDRTNKIMLAVLPFENLGLAEDEYFADGITDEIISRLAALHGLGVISRTSSLQYKKTKKSVREIGNELGVEYLLEGTIRWDKSGGQSRVRINAQLIKVLDDTHLWANSYDAVINDIFAVQSAIASRVVEKLDITLLYSEKEVLNEQTSINIEAYTYYLLASEYLYSPPSSENLKKAINMFKSAIKLEPEFADAYVWLSFAHGQMVLFGYDQSEERKRSSKTAIDRAFEIAPDSPEAHGALGWYYYQCFRDYDKALDEFTILANSRPSDGTAYMGIAVIKRTQGNWVASAKNWQKAIELDPLESRISFEYAYTLLGLRRYAETELFLDRAIKLDPDWFTLYIDKSQLYIIWKGDVEAAREVLVQAQNTAGQSPELNLIEIKLDIYDRLYDRALSKLLALGINLEAYEDNAQYYNLKGNVFRYLNRTEEMKASYDSARVVLERLVPSEPDDPFYHARLGLAYAGLGRHLEAIREGKLAGQIMPISKNATRGAEITEYLVKIFILTGEYELALDQLELLLSRPSEISIKLLQISPEYLPLQNHARFKALIEKYEK